MPFTRQEIKEANLVTEEELRDILSSEMRAVVHSIRNEVQGIKSLVDIHVIRIDKCEQLITTHVKACMESKSSLDEMRGILDSIKNKLRFASTLKDGVIWIASTTVTIVELWKVFH